MSRKLSVGALALLAGLAVPAAGSAQVSGFSFGVGGLFDGVSFGFGVSAWDGYSDGYYDTGYYDDGYYGDPYASSAWCSYGPVPPYGYGSGFGYMRGVGSHAVLGARRPEFGVVQRLHPGWLSPRLPRLPRAAPLLAAPQ